MNTIPVPKNEQGRIAALKLYDILDTEAEQEFDNLAQLAAEICNTPIALINLIDERRQWAKARVGLDVQEIPRDYSFCYYTILDDEIFEVTNPLADSRFDKNPLVTGHSGIRFYAGVPLINADGYRLGTLCVMSPKHHQLNSYQRISLQIIGSSVMSLLELRREKQETALFRSALDEVASLTIVDANNTITYANALFCQLTGLKVGELKGRNNNEIKLADMAAEQAAEIQDSIAARKTWRGIVKNQNIKGAVSWTDLTVMPVANKDNDLIKVMFIRNEVTEEVLLRERLEESETIAKTGRWELNIFNRNTTWTPGMFALLEGDSDDNKLSGQSIMNFISPADFERVNEANKKLLEKKTNGDKIEFRIITRQGKEKDINAIVKKRFNTKGGLTGIYGTLMDVTDLKAAERTLSDQQQQLTELYNNAPCAYLSADSEGNLTDANATALLWLGYTSDEVVGKLKQTDILHASSFTAFEDGWAWLQKTGFLNNLAIVCKRKNRSFFNATVSALAIYNDAGKFTGAKLTLQDVTELHTLRQQLAEAQTKGNKQYQNDDLLLIVLDEGGTINYVSERLQVLTGIGNIDSKKSPFFFAWNDEWQQKASLFFTDQLRNKTPESLFLMPVKDKADEKLWMEVTGTLLLEDGRVKGLRASLYDVTTRVETEEKLHEVAWIAMEAKDMQQLVLEQMNSDVRKPMEGIMGIINLLGTTHLSVEQKVLVSGLKETAGEMLKQITGILDGAKVKHTPPGLEIVEFELKGLVNSIIYTLKPEADKKNIRFILQVDNKIPATVTADKGALSKILMNLAGNALKFTEKGSISIGVFQKGIDGEKLTLEIIVKDSGVGIPQHKLDTIFESFTGGERNPRSAEGSGLGLAIARQLVEQQNGEIKVRSQEGQGTTFSFTYFVTVPKGAVAENLPGVQNVDENNALAGYHILLVEDNTMNQRIGRTMLENWGAEVTVADLGKKALTLVTANRYDLILMDIQMPEMSGIEATAIIRQDLMDDTPIMGMTVSEMQASRESCIRAGMNDYILKPLKPAELHRKVFALLNKPETKLKERVVNTTYVKEKITNINYLKNITNDDIALTREILEIYIEKTPALMEELEQQMANRNYKSAQAGAHYLKNSVGLLGADTLFHMFASIENQLNHIPPSTETFDLLAKIKAIINESIEESAEELKSL